MKPSFDPTQSGATRNRFVIFVLWIVFYASFALFAPAASTLGSYLRRPGPGTQQLHILNSRSSILWSGRFFTE